MAKTEAVKQTTTRVLTEEGRARIAAAQQRRWKKFRKEKKAAEKAAKESK
jgi:hypothetical protein